VVQAEMSIMNCKNVVNNARLAGRKDLSSDSERWGQTEFYFGGANKYVNEEPINIILMVNNNDGT
jgi:hypothetical protein